MRNTVLHIQAKVHPVTTSISVKFRGMKAHIDISKRWTSHFRISYRFRDICLDCRSFINISDWMVQKIKFYWNNNLQMIQLEYSVDFTSYGACKSVFSRHRVNSDFDFCSQYSVSLSALQPAITASCLFSSVFSDLCSTSAFLPLKSSHRPGYRCP